jgi:hypothetical protein
MAAESDVTIHITRWVNQLAAKKKKKKTEDFLFFFLCWK